MLFFLNPIWEKADAECLHIIKALLIQPPGNSTSSSQTPGSSHIAPVKALGVLKVVVATLLMSDFFGSVEPGTLRATADASSASKSYEG